jgi:hypothetical protein
MRRPHPPLRASHPAILRQSRSPLRRAILPAPPHPVRRLFPSFALSCLFTTPVSHSPSHRGLLGARCALPSSERAPPQTPPHRARLSIYVDQAVAAPMSSAPASLSRDTEPPHPSSFASDASAAIASPELSSAASNYLAGASPPRCRASN